MCVCMKVVYEQALVNLSNREIVDATRADGVHFIAKLRITVFPSKCFGLLYLTI